MNNFKHILTIIAVIAFQNLNAQFKDLKGITIQASSVSYYDSDSLKKDVVDELYNFSFKDYILVHNTYQSGKISSSQVYSFTDINNYMDGLITVFKGTAISGLSGKKYTYETKIAEDGSLLQMIRTQPDGITSEFFKGGVIEFKTFMQ